LANLLNWENRGYCTTVETSEKDKATFSFVPEGKSYIGRDSFDGSHTPGYAVQSESAINYVGSAVDVGFRPVMIVVKR